LNSKFGKYVISFDTARFGAKKAYLQVVDESTKVIELYKKLGFTDKYQYWYRVKALSRENYEQIIIGCSRICCDRAY